MPSLRAALRLILPLLALCFAPAHASAAEPPVTWSVAPAQTPTVGGEIELVITARIAPRWIVYASDFKAEIGPQPTEFHFSPHVAFQPIGKPVSIGAKAGRDKTWEVDYGYFSERAEFRQRVKVLALPLRGSVRIKGQLCNERDGSCTLLNEVVTW
jgi:hypothetical protein